MPTPSVVVGAVRSRLTPLTRAWFVGSCLAAALLLTAAQAAAQPAAQITRLNKQALDAYDNLNFDQAKSLLEEALNLAASDNLGSDPATARTHLNLGMVLIAGFQKRDEAVDHFRSALKIQPGIAPPRGLFNPEAQAAFDEAKAAAATEAAAAATAPPKVSPPEEEEDEDEDEEDGTSFERGMEPPPPVSPNAGEGTFAISILGGSGAGFASGHVDVNTDAAGKKFPWPGTGAMSKAGHLTLSVGYFVWAQLMLSVEARYQFITGVTKVWDSKGCMENGCTPPGSAFAALARASWFLSNGPFRWFGSLGVGGGTIRHVVTVRTEERNPDTGMKQVTMDCGPMKPASSTSGQTCVDTVAGGPLFLSPGAGFVYELGSLFLLGTANVYLGAPSLLLHLDVNLGLGLRI